MFSLEKECWREYKKKKKSLKTYNKKINTTETEFYKVFYYISNEYYYDLRKEFTDKEIIEACNVKETLLSEIKAFLKIKNLATIKPDKIVISYETVVFLDNMINNYKSYYINLPISIIAIVLAIFSLLISIMNNTISNTIIIIGIIALMFLLSSIAKEKIYKMSQYK